MESPPGRRSGVDEQPRKADSNLSAVQLSQLQQLVEFAQRLSRSSGAAIAWGDLRQMECVASSGATAPPLGTVIDPSSGLARDCIRTGEVATCVDAAVDLRVSHQACEALGISSLLYLPIFTSQGKVRGLLGVFADAPFHFSDSDIAHLKGLSGSVDSLLNGAEFKASARLIELPTVAAEAASIEQPLEVAAQPKELEVASDVEPHFATASSRSRIPLLTVAAVGMVIATAGWISYKGENRVQAKAPAPTVVAPPPVAQPAVTPIAKPVASADAKITVVIDPGHGGRDQGTTSPNGLLEKDLTLDIAQRLGELLKDKLGCDVIFTRENDKYVPLETRAEIANNAHADFLISIHGNSSSYEDVRGVETFYFRSSGEALAANESTGINPPEGSDSADAAKSFAADVQAALLSGLKEGKHMLRDRGVKPASFVVLRDVQMPAVLAEVSFMSSSKDAEQLDSADYREKVAEALYSGIANHVSHQKSLNAVADLNQNKDVAQP